MPQTEEKQLSYGCIALGLVLNCGGVYGIWFQGDFWGQLGGCIRGNLNVDELYLVLGSPAGATVAGTLLVAWALLGSPVALKWTGRRRNVAFACYAVIVVAAISLAAILGSHHLWAVER
jgi:hypothetical protein